MKLNFVHAKQNGLPEVIVESYNDSDEIERPLGMTKAEWTPDMQEHFRYIRKSDPKLYHKISIGH